MIQFIKYAIFGGIGVGTDLSIYVISLSLNIFYQYANIVGYISGTLISFLCNRKYTFEVSDRPVLRLLLFFGAAAVGYFVSLIALHLFVEDYHFSPLVSKLLILPIVLMIQFAINKYVTFRE